jgi:replicative DNA helicase
MHSDSAQKIDVSKKFAELAERKPLTNNELNTMAKKEEARFISLVLNDKDSFVDAVSRRHITFEHFIHLEHCEFYMYLTSYYTRYGGALLTRDAFQSVVEQYGKSDMLPRFMSMYEHFKTTKVSPEDYEMLVEGIVSRCAQSRLFNVTGGGNALIDIWKATTTDQHLAIRKLIDKMEDSLASVGQTQDAFFSAEIASSLSSEFVKDMEKAKTTPLNERALLCGINCIDDEFLGFLRSKYMVFLGFPNGGKTTMMMNFASNMARQGYKIGYVTVESMGKEVVGRLLSRHSGIPSKTMKRVTGPDGMTDEMWNKLYTSKEEFDKGEGSRLFVITVNQKTPITEILSLTDKYSEVLGGFDAVFFDYLEVFGPAPNMRSKDRWVELTGISQEIQGWGKSRNVLVATAQSITNEKIKEFRKKDFLDNAENADVFVGVENVGGSQSITRDADYVFSVVIHPKSSRLIIYVTKARSDGRANQRFLVGWNPAICDIYDLDTALCGHRQKAEQSDAALVSSPGDGPIVMLVDQFKKKEVPPGVTEAFSHIFQSGGTTHIDEIFAGSEIWRSAS